MITQPSLTLYRGSALIRGNDFIYVLPHWLLRPYISCYTLTFPAGIPDDYTVLPSASATLVISVGASAFDSHLHGVNTQSNRVGAHANKMDLLLLIEFRSGGLYPFLSIDQSELTDRSFVMAELDPSLTRALENELLRAERVEDLLAALDHLFLTRLAAERANRHVAAMMRLIAERNGNITARELSARFFYSEKHIRRLFLQHIGTGPKVFSRITRVNHALRLLQTGITPLTDVAEQAGFFDQPHFIHDFEAVCGITPSTYLKNKSVFYNDEYKM